MSETISPNTTIAHYRIVSKIGAGGMGEVYLAQDTKLDRKVALKILPTELAVNQDRMRRFVQEAKSAAALNHPNIATIHDIGESDGTNFIAMEFIDGQTLREEIHQERAPLQKLLKYLQQVAEGLAKAHSAGIVHRDLKPDNIMITRDGHAKILDFGLAKLVEQQPLATGDSSEVATAVMPQHSSPGAIMGTAGYMSPEQAKAKPVDQRSDIFSFGCVLYEAATGRKPFVGDSMVETLHKIISDPAPAITDSNPNAPAELQRIIRKCLAKEPEKRYQLIRDTANDLEEVIEELRGVSDIERSVVPSTSAGTVAVGSVQSTHSVTQPASSAEYVVSGIKSHKLAVAAVAVLIVGVLGGGYWFWRGRVAGSNQITSIAVMPFVNESGNADVEYLSDGMTETLISSLTQLPNLNVKSRSSVFRYKGKDSDPKTVGEELNVQAILIGRVVQRGEQLTLNLELVDVATENAIWSQQYNRKESDLVSLQNEIAREVSSKLKSKLSSAETSRIEKAYTANAEAYQLYLKGRFQWNKRTGESLKQSVEFFNQAIEKDPNYALAYAGLAESYELFGSYSVALPQEFMPKARAAAVRAIELDDTLAEAHCALAIYLSTFSWNQPAAEREFRRAIQLNPNYPTAHQQFANFCLMAMGRFDESIAEGRRAEELDPLSSVISMDVGANLTRARRFDEAIAQFNRTLALDPNFYAARYALGTAYHANGQYGEAIAEFRKALALNDDPWVKALLARSLAKSGQRDAALKILGELQAESAHRYVSSSGLAIVFAALGEKDKAFVWLEKDIAERSQRPPLFSVNPVFDDLRDDPRFKDLLRRIELAKTD
ncbi:MAG: protein kinase domain-containing protein [Pyrinomonadaceae bacterium]